MVTTKRSLTPYSLEYSNPQISQILPFLYAQLARNYSFAWKIILAARVVLENGLRWGLGKGEKIGICQHHWLPTLVL